MTLDRLALLHVLCAVVELDPINVETQVANPRQGTRTQATGPELLVGREDFRNL